MKTAIVMALWGTFCWCVGYLWGKQAGLREGWRDARKVEEQWLDYFDLDRQHQERHANENPRA